ncbi:MAG: thioredoxin family protein [Spirochaetales bacterium]|nr:thioredoxin family protein [Spirochaetales bacterium]
MNQKKLQIIGLILMLPFLLFAEVEWRTNYDDALGEASITRQNIFVIITAPSWCGPCQYMEENVFPVSSVVEALNARFIPLQVLDEVNGRSNPDLQNFDFIGFPTYLVMDPDENILIQDAGAVDVATLLALIEPYFSDDDFVPEFNPGSGPIFGEEPDVDPSLFVQPGNEPVIPDPEPIGGSISVPSRLVSYYNFNDGFEDLSGKGSIVNPYDPGTIDGTVYSDGTYGTSEFVMAPADFSFEEFTVGLRFKVEEISSWRMNILAGGTSYRWFSIRYTDDELEVTLNNQDDIFGTSLKRVVDPGNWYSIVCSVNLNSGKVFFSFSDREPVVINLPAGFELAAITAGADYDKVFSFTNYSNGTKFQGYIDDLFVFNTALSVDEVFRISTDGIESFLK